MRWRAVILAFLFAASAVSGPAADREDESFLFAKRLLLDRQEHDSAAKKLSEFVATYPASPNVPEALYYMGYCYAHLKRHKEAAAAYDKLLREHPRAPEKFRQEAMKYGGDAYFKQGAHEKAAELYSMLIKQYPESAFTEDALFWCAMAYDRIAVAHRDNGDPDQFRAFAAKAIGGFRDFVTRYPASKQVPAALRNAGFVALDASDPAAAATYFSRLVSRFPDEPRAAEHLFYYAESLYRQKKYAESRVQFASLLKRFPTWKRVADARSGMAWCDYELAKTLRDQGQEAQARERILAAAEGFEQVAALAGKDEAKALQARFDAGRAYYEGGSYEEAIQQLRIVATAGDSPLRGSARFNLGTFRLEQAKQAAGKLQGLSPEAPEYDALNRAHQALLNEATTYLSEAIDDPTIGAEGPEAATFLGEAYLDAKEYAKAEAAFSRIAKDWPDDERAPLALYHLALARREQGKLESAAEAIRTLIRSHPTSRLRLKAAYVMADYQAARGEHEKSRMAYQWIVDNGVTWAKGWRGPANQEDPALVRSAQELVADCLFRIGESYFLSDAKAQEARPYYERVIQDHPDAPPAIMSRLRLAEIYEEAGQLTEAIAEYAFVVKAGNTTAAYRPALYQMGVAQFSLARKSEGDAATRGYAAAQNLLERFVESFPEDSLTSLAVYYLAEIDYASGKYQDALSAYARSLRIAPKGLLADAAWYGAGWSHRLLGNAAKSLEAFGTLVRDFPESDYRAEAMYLVAVAKREAKQHAEALQDLDALLDAYPKSIFAARAQIEKGRVLDDLGRYDASIETFEKFIESHPGHADTAWALYNLSYAWWHKVEPLFEQARVAAEAYHKAEPDARDAAKATWDEALTQARKVEDRMASVLERLTREFPKYELIDGVWLRWGEVAYDRGDYEVALKRYVQSLVAGRDKGESGDAPRAQYRIAWCHWRLAEQIAAQLHSSDATTAARLQEKLASHRQKSETAFIDLGTRFPNHPLAAESLFRAAELQRETGRAGEALALYRKALETAGEGEFVRAARYGIGVCLLETNKDREALTEFRSFLNDFDTGTYVPAAHWGAGMASLNLSATADAKMHFEKSLDLDDESESAARARLGLGMIALQNQNWELAREEFLKVDAFHSRWHRWAALALLKSSEAATKLGHETKAKADLERIVDRYPNTPAAIEASKRLGKN